MKIDVESRIREANPVLRDEVLEQLFGDDASRRLRLDIRAGTEGRMTDTNQRRTTESRPEPDSQSPERPHLRPTQPKRGLAAAAAAFVVIVGAGIVLFLATSKDEAPPASPSPTEAPAPTAPPEAAPAPPQEVPPPAEPDLQVLAEQFVDAYVLSDLGALQEIVRPGALLGTFEYLVGWNVAADYEVVDRAPCTARNFAATCTLVGSDDWSKALGIQTIDTFDLTLSDGRFVAVDWTVEFTPALVQAEFDLWLRDAHPELFEAGGSCAGFFADGTTPGDCARAWVDAANEYNRAEREALAEQFVDAFVSFDADMMNQLVDPTTDIDAILYVARMGESLNYEILERRPCSAANRNTVTCSVTGTDDVWGALGARFTDTLTITAPDGEIATVGWRVVFTPDGIYEQFTDWLDETHPELYETGGACAGFLRKAGTPSECGLAWLALVDEFKETAASG